MSSASGDRHPVPRAIRERLEQTPEGRRLLTEPIRSSAAPPEPGDQPKGYPMTVTDYELTEAEVRERLGLSESDLTVELLLHLDGKARPALGPGLYYSRSRVARAQTWLAEREQAGVSAAAELLLSEAGHRPTPHPGRYSVAQRADRLALEFKAAGFTP